MRSIVLFFIFSLLHNSVAILEPVEAESFCDAEQNVNCQNSEVENVLIDESLNALDQEDPILIEAVRQRIVLPPDGAVPYNLSAKFETKTMSGEFNQVPHLVKLFGAKKKDGFFIEAGAHDGEEISNTLYFEKAMGWKGLLVEPNPITFKTLLSKKRKAFAFGHCLSPFTHPVGVDFDAADVFGGIINDGKKLSDESIPAKTRAFPDLKVDTKTIRVQCFPLFTILKAIGNPKIDFFSLDIEGADFQVLQSLPWDKVKIDVLMVEVFHFGKIFEGTEQEFENFLSEKGYRFYKSAWLDKIYVRNDFKLPGEEKTDNSKKKKKKNAKTKKN